MAAIHAQPGDRGKVGQPVVTLSNVDIEIKVGRLQAQKHQLETKLASLRQRARQSFRKNFGVGA